MVSVGTRGSSEFARKIWIALRVSSSAIAPCHDTGQVPETDVNLSQEECRRMTR